jgi:hypothetical protein
MTSSPDCRAYAKRVPIAGLHAVLRMMINTLGPVNN